MWVAKYQKLDLFWQLFKIFWGFYDFVLLRSIRLKSNWMLYWVATLIDAGTERTGRFVDTSIEPIK